MGATAFIRGGTGAQRGQRFPTRNAGNAMARKVWMCSTCNGWHQPPPGRNGRQRAPTQCERCGPGVKLLKCDSEVEARRWAQLWLMAAAGEIGDLTHHPDFELMAPGPDDGRPVLVGKYQGDSAYRMHRRSLGDWVLVVEDVKPRSPDARTELCNWKLRHFRAQFGFDVSIVSP